MIDPALRHEIKGLDELFKIISEESDFHDYKLESFQWNQDEGELTLTYSNEMWVNSIVGKTPHNIIFHLIPEWNDFEIHISPYDPFTVGIQIYKSDTRKDCYHFEAENSGPIVECEDMWVEVKIGDSKDCSK